MQKLVLQGLVLLSIIAFEVTLLFLLDQVELQIVRVDFQVEDTPCFGFFALFDFKLVSLFLVDF